MGLAVALALDAFAVAVAAGISLGRASGRQTFRLAFHFGLFQFLMPLAGWAVGAEAGRLLEAVDHWIALALLAAVGGRMILGSLRAEDTRPRRDPTRGWSLVLLSVATSLDALAVGLSLGLLGTPIWYPAAVIGAVCCALTAAGLHVGRPVAARLGRRLEAAGGAVLILVGLRILLSHL